MAKFLSQVYTTIRGSVGGITYTANQFQALIARARVSPVNPNTSFQSMMRSAFAGASQLWRDSSDVNRQAWDDYADTLVYQGPLGSYSVPGRQVMIGNISTALYLLERGVLVAAVTADPPVKPGFLDVSDVAAGVYVPVGTGIAVNMTYVGTEAWCAYSDRSFAFDPSRYRFKGPFLSSKMDGVISVGAASIQIEFDGLVEDLIYFTNPRAITSEPPFRMSPSYYLRHIAVNNLV